MDNKKIVAGILILIPFVAYFILPLYNSQYPEAFGLLSSSLMSSPFGLLFIGATATAINLVIALVWSAISRARPLRIL